MKTVIEIRRISARNTFIAVSVYVVLNSLLNWEPVERLKQRWNVVSFTFFQYEASSTVLYGLRRRLWTEEGRLERRLHTSVRHEPAHDRFCLTRRAVDANI